MSIVNLMDSIVWSPEDITNRVRAGIESRVSNARRQELLTIMLGQIAGLRAATQSEMAEILFVKTLTEAAAAESATARADMALLQSALDYEAAQRRLELPSFDGPETITVTDIEGHETTVPNPAFVTDRDEREAAMALLDAAEPETIDLVAQRLAYHTPIPAPTEAPLFNEGV